MTRLFEYESKQIIQETDAVKREQLINEGKAIKLDIPELTKLEQEANELYEKHQADVQRIKESDNPLLQDAKVQEYELNKLEEPYRTKSAEIEEKYTQWRAQEIEDARTRAAQATIEVKDSDRTVAEQFKDRASLKLAGAGDQGVALQEIRKDIELLTDGQKTALQGHIVSLLSSIDADDPMSKHLLINAVQDIRNEDILSLTVAEQLPHSVLTMQRIHDISKKVASESSALSGGGISKEFYDKHLKGANK